MDQRRPLGELPDTPEDSQDGSWRQQDRALGPHCGEGHDQDPTTAENSEHCPGWWGHPHGQWREAARCWIPLATTGEHSPNTAPPAADTQCSRRSDHADPGTGWPAVNHDEGASGHQDEWAACSHRKVADWHSGPQETENGMTIPAGTAVRSADADQFCHCPFQANQFLYRKLADWCLKIVAEVATVQSIRPATDPWHASFTASSWWVLCVMVKPRIQGQSWVLPILQGPWGRHHSMTQFWQTHWSPQSGGYLNQPGMRLHHPGMLRKIVSVWKGFPECCRRRNTTQWGNVSSHFTSGYTGWLQLATDSRCGCPVINFMHIFKLSHQGGAFSTSERIEHGS